MKPVYFPDAFISKPIRRALFSCFQQTAVYQPARKLVPESLLRLEREGRLEICLPEEESPDNLPNLLKAYHAWADLHRGERPDFHKFSPLHSPGVDDASGAWIRSKIRGAERGEGNGLPAEIDKEAALLLEARLFLAICQEYNLQQESLSEDLRGIGSMEQNLLQNLMPDAEEPPAIEPPPPFSKMPGADYPMPAERLAAWCRLYAHHHLRPANKGTSPTTPLPFFITADQKVLDLLTARSDTVEVVGRIFNLPLIGEDEPSVKSAIHENIHKLLRTAVDGRLLSAAAEISFDEKGKHEEATGTLTLYRVRGDCVAAHLSGLEGIPESMTQTPTGGKKPCTLLGCILLNQHA